MSMVIIDFLNLSVALKLIKNERGSNVSSLFKSKSVVMEKLLVIFLRLFGISYSIDEMDFDKIPINPTVKIDHNTEVLSKLIASQYLLQSNSKFDDFVEYSVRSWLFMTLWRSISIIEYVKCMDYNISTIYFAAPINRKLLSRLIHEQYDSLTIGLVCYSSIGLMDDEGYIYQTSKPKIRYAGKIINQMVRLFYVLIYLKVRKRICNNKIDAILFSHEVGFKWLGIDEISEYTKFDCWIAYPDGVISNGINSVTIRSIPLTEVIAFYRHLISGLSEYYWASHISIDLYTYLLSAWKDYYFLKNIYKEQQVKLVLSGVESNLSQTAVAIASDSENIISLDCIWSVGNLPSEFVITTHKYSDRCFIWGMWHYELMEESNNKASGYIITGYVGDLYISKMIESGHELYDNYMWEYDGIITVYDAPIIKGYSYSKSTIYEYIKAVMLVAVEFNVLVILKVKKETDFHADIAELYSNQLIIECEKGSIAPALISNVVVGLSNSTPASVAAVHGKKVVTYNPAGNVWNKWMAYSDHYPIVKSLPDLQAVLREYLSANLSQVKFATKYIDPFGDGNAQYRMANYMNDVFDNLSFGKEESLFQADILYKKQWGDDNVLIK